MPPLLQFVSDKCFCSWGNAVWPRTDNKIVATAGYDIQNHQLTTFFFFCRNWQHARFILGFHADTLPSSPHIPSAQGVLYNDAGIRHAVPCLRFRGYAQTVQEHGILICRQLLALMNVIRPHVAPAVPASKYNRAVIWWYPTGTGLDAARTFNS